jgi:hypothetical protein
MVLQTTILLKMSSLWLSLHSTQILMSTSISQNSFCYAAVFVSWTKGATLLLKTVAHIYWLPTQILALHLCNRIVGRLEVIKTYEAILFRFSCLWVSHYFGRDNNTKLSENIFQLFFVNWRVQVSHKNVCSNLLCSLILRSFVYFYCFSIKLNHVKQFYAIIRILFILKLNETKVLMFISYFVTR